jgi:signal transduction histidine kinase/ligand-binding sensor domain-containing protein
MQTLRSIPARFFWLFCLATSVWAVDPSRHISQYAHSAWRIQDGNLSGAPTAIAQTSDGYLWIGTQNGLVRFDGVRFVPWTFPDGKVLPAPIITFLLADRDGSLWIGTAQGLAHWKDNSELVDYSKFSGGINQMFQDTQGVIWLTRFRFSDGKGPLCRVAGADLQCYGQADGIPFTFGTALVEDSNHNFWVGGQALCRWKPGPATVYLSKSLQRSSGLLPVVALASGPGGSVWAALEGTGHGSGLQRFVGGVWQDYVVSGLNGANVRGTYLLVDRDQVLWIGTADQGIYRVHDGKAEHFRSEDGLSSNEVEALYQDHEGNIWVSTKRGIDLFRDFQVTGFSTREGWPSDSVNAVLAAHDGTLWMSAEGALEAFRHDKFSVIREHQGLPGNAVTALFEDHRGRMWVGVDDGLTVYEHGKFSQVRRADGSPLGITTAVIEDIDQNIWAIVVTKTSRNPNRLIRIREMKLSEQIDDDRAPGPVSIAADPRGGIWFGLVGGDIGRHDRGRIEIFHFEHKSGPYGIRQIHLDSDSSILGATGSGLVGWRNGKFQTLTTRNGAPCDNVLALISDRQDALWLYTQCGLVTIAKQDLQEWWQNPDAKVRLRVFDVLDGAQPHKTSFQPATTISPDGRLWFVGNLLQTIDPGRAITNSTPPPVHVEEVVADHKSYSPGASVSLPPLTRDLEIKYTGLSFAIPQRVRFRYKLEGHDSAWQDPGTRRQAFYNDLRPGHYRFRVIACNNDGIWNDTGATLDFSVAPAWFQTKWFLALCVLSASFIVWVVYRFRVQQIRKSLSARFDGRLAERTRMARELHDTFLQTLQGSKLVADNALEDSSDPAQMGRAMEQLSVWLGRAIDEGRAALNSLRTSTTQKNDLAEAFTRAMEESRMHSPMEVSFSVMGDSKEMHPVVRDEIYRIGYEAIRNAYKHSKGDRLEVALRYGKDLVLRVGDNGIGIDPTFADHGKDGHFGLRGMRERAARIGGKLTIVSSANRGTEITIVVPGGVVFQKPSASALDKIKNSLRWTSRTFHAD